jgi:hypothetical protein
MVRTYGQLLVLFVLFMLKKTATYAMHYGENIYQKTLRRTSFFVYHVITTFINICFINILFFVLFYRAN